MLKKWITLFALIILPWGGFASKIKVGVTAGPHADVIAFVRDQAKNDGWDIQIIEFNDFVLPNLALDQGDIDMNSYQHQPFLDNQIEMRGYAIMPIGKSLLMPMGVYSKKYTTLNDLPEKAKIGIPNDPTNGGRALLLLQAQGLIKLKANAGLIPSILDIQENPKKLKIIELEAPQLPRSLQDVDIACINTDWVLISGLTDVHVLGQESVDSPYTNVIVIRARDKDDPRWQKFLKLYQSDATKQFIEERFKGAVLPGW